MPCLNLKAEIAKNVSIEAIAKFLKTYRNSVANKINGDSAFTIDEAFQVQEKFFSGLKMDYLFKKEGE